MRLCCQEIVTIYLALFNPPRENANLYCPECNARIVNESGHWVERT